MELKAVGALAVRKEVPPAVSDTSNVKLDDEDDVNAGEPAVRVRRLSQVTADIGAGLRTAGATAKEAVADPEEQGITDVPKSRDLGLAGDGGQVDELRDITHGCRKLKL